MINADNCPKVDIGKLCVVIAKLAIIYLRQPSSVITAMCLLILKFSAVTSRLVIAFTRKFLANAAQQAVRKFRCGITWRYDRNAGVLVNIMVDLCGGEHVVHLLKPNSRFLSRLSFRGFWHNSNRFAF